MKEYFIYIQKTRVLSENEKGIYYIYESPCLINIVTGSKNLYLFFKNKYNISINKDFQKGIVFKEKRQLEPIEKEFGFLGYPLVNPPKEIYQIKNKNNELIDYKEITKKYQKRNSYHKSKNGYFYSKGSNIADRRKNLTPEEFKEIKNLYHITIKDSPIINPWIEEKITKIERNWKTQIKKRKRYF